MINDARRFIDKNTLIIIDPTDVCKPHALKMEHLTLVRDASRSSKDNVVRTRGYHGCMAVACRSGSRKTVPLALKLWSSNAEGHKGENEEVLDILREIDKATDGKRIVARRARLSLYQKHPVSGMSRHGLLPSVQSYAPDEGRLRSKSLECCERLLQRRFDRQSGEPRNREGCAEETCFGGKVAKQRRSRPQGPAQCTAAFVTAITDAKARHGLCLSDCDALPVIKNDETPDVSAATNLLQEVAPRMATFWYTIEYKEGSPMSYTINITEAPERISGLLADVEKALATIVIMRDNRPIAQILPLQKRREIKKIPSLTCKVDFADLCSDDSAMWDACDA